MKNPVNRGIGIYAGGFAFLFTGSMLGLALMNNLIVGFYLGLAAFLYVLIVFARNE